MNTDHLYSNRIKLGKRTSVDTVDDVKARLLWMADHVDEWLHWGNSRWAVKDLREPAFERKVISPSRRNFEYLADSDLAPGLWLKYRGIQ